MTGEHVQFRSGKRRQTEERIIAAAADLFLEHGYRATTVRAIAKAAEVSVGRVMSAGDKDDILIRCFDRWIGRLQDGTYTPPPPRRPRPTSGAVATEAAPGAVGSEAASSGSPAAGRARTASAVQRHLLEIFLPFLEFFAAHEDLSRDYAAALIRIKSDPEVFNALAVDLQGRLSESLVSIGINENHARASAAALYDSYLGILLRWAASDMSREEATEALSSSIAFHTQLRRPI